MQKLQYIDVELIDPHPDNPRKDLGDLTELAESIRQTALCKISQSSSRPMTPENGTGGIPP